MSSTTTHACRRSRSSRSAQKQAALYDGPMQVTDLEAWEHQRTRAKDLPGLRQLMERPSPFGSERSVPATRAALAAP
jgi:hypothetical protein